MQRINSQSFDTTIGDSDIRVEKMSLDITDNTAPASSGGRPDGWVQGDVSAAGELELTASEFKKLKAEAQKAKSWQAIEPFDIVAYAKAGDEEMKIEAFGCKIKLNKVLDIDKSTSDRTKFNVPFDVTSRDFVNIDGIPYIEAEK